MIKNKALFALATFMLASMLTLPILTVAPNRMMTPQGVSFIQLWQSSAGQSLWVIIGLLVFVLAASFIQYRWIDYLIIFVSLGLIVCLLVFSGQWAALQLSHVGSLGRVSFGGGFWTLLLLFWLMGLDAIARKTENVAFRSLGFLILLIPLVIVLFLFDVTQLSIFKEYSNNKAAFDSASQQHMLIVGWTLLLTLLIGLPLGWYSFRFTRSGRYVLSILSIIQTIPSVALFGLLIAPLAVLSTTFPSLGDLGISGVGLAPAVIALTMYSLLPIVRSIISGFEQVPHDVLEAATGLGLSAFQRFSWVEVRLALPVFLSGLRVTLVQAVGLAVVAALIGAGGFGAIIFRGLSASVLDLVLLGVIPVVMLSIVVDSLFKIIVSVLETKKGKP